MLPHSLPEGNRRMSKPVAARTDADDAAAGLIATYQAIRTTCVPKPSIVGSELARFCRQQCCQRPLFHHQRCGRCST
jgi:hypothetical protein